MKAKNIIRLETLQKAKLKIISVDKFRVDAIFLYKNKKSLLTWYNDYFIEMDLLNCIDDETFDIMIDEVMDICANYHFCKNFGGWNIPPISLKIECSYFLLCMVQSYL